MPENNFVYWHIELERLLGRKITTKEIAVGARIEPTNYSRCVKSGHLPDSLKLLFKLWKYYRQFFPEINMQDLIKASME